MNISELKKGDKVVGPVLFPGVCEDKVDLTVVTVKKGSLMDAVEFSGKYRGVNVGRLTAYDNGKSVQWGVLG